MLVKFQMTKQKMFCSIIYIIYKCNVKIQMSECVCVCVLVVYNIYLKKSGDLHTLVGQFDIKTYILEIILL